jgi:hypothetical protein
MSFVDEGGYVEFTNLYLVVSYEGVYHVTIIFIYSTYEFCTTGKKQ